MNDRLIYKTIVQ